MKLKKYAVVLIDSVLLLSEMKPILMRSLHYFIQTLYESFIEL